MQTNLFSIDCDISSSSIPQSMGFFEIASYLSTNEPAFIYLQ